MHRLNITINEELQMQATDHAKKLGLSLSAFIRLLLIREMSTKNPIEKRLHEIEKGGFEPFDMGSLRQDIDNAKA